MNSFVSIDPKKKKKKKALFDHNKKQSLSYFRQTEKKQHPERADIDTQTTLLTTGMLDKSVIMSFTSGDFLSTLKTQRKWLFIFSISPIPTFPSLICDLVSSHLCVVIVVCIHRRLHSSFTEFASHNGLAVFIYSNVAKFMGKWGCKTYSKLELIKLMKCALIKLA